MDKVALISDIHGNLEALQTVLRDIKERGINRIICLGDITAKGKYIKECLELVKDNCEVVIRGNCDEFYSSDIDIDTIPDKFKIPFQWNRCKLTEEDLNYLRGLPYCYEFYMSGRLIRLFHAHQERIDKFAGNIDKLEKLYELFLPSDNTISDLKADIVIYGHIHTQYVQRIYNRTIINVGSVGNSIDVIRNDDKDGNVKNTTCANYVILTGAYNSTDVNNKISYELVSIPYDIEKELDNNKDNYDLEAYREELLSGKYRNMEKVYASFEGRGIDKDKV